MAVGTAGISTLGVKFGWGIGTGTTKPGTMTQIERCSNIAGISLETEQLDASALEDYVTRYIAGRQDTGGSYPVSFNYTEEIASQIEAMFTAYAGLSSGQKLWVEVWSPFLSNGFFAIVQCPKAIPQPEFGQNEVLIMEISFVIEDYKGSLPGIEPTSSYSG